MRRRPRVSWTHSKVEVVEGEKDQREREREKERKKESPGKTENPAADGKGLRNVSALVAASDGPNAVSLSSKHPPRCLQSLPNSIWPRPSPCPATRIPPTPATVPKGKRNRPTEPTRAPSAIATSPSPGMTPVRTVDILRARHSKTGADHRWGCC